MVVHGENSLNDRTEDEGLTPPGGSEEPVDDEPTKEQLIATGELEPEPEEEVPESPAEVEPSSTEVAVIKKEEEESLSIRKQVRNRLLEGATRDELLAEGYNKSTISTVASEVKKELGTRKPIGKPTVARGEGIPVTAKGVPPEVIIEALEVPDISDGGGFVFEQGMKFGMSVVTLGIRMAQELSGIGVMQAKPLLDMAKSMREGESLAAKNAAGEAAMEAAGIVQQNMMPILASLQQNVPAGVDPMKAMMARTMEPIISNMMGGLFGRLLPGGAVQPQLGPGQSAPPPTEGWSRRVEEKPKEEEKKEE